MADNEQLQDLLRLEDGLGFCWTGNTGWLVRGEGRLIAFDLDLEYPGMRLAKPPVTAEEVAPHLDILLVTHGHGDHFNDPTCRVLAEQSDCMFVVPWNCVEKAAALGISGDRTVVVTPREPLVVDGMPVEPVRAYHGWQGAAADAAPEEFDCGYVVTLAGRRIFHPGDSVLLQDHLELRDIDVLFISPTTHNTHIHRSVKIIETLQPEHIFPQHFGTYTITPENDFWTHGYPDELAAALPAELRGRYHKLSQGELFVVQSGTD